MRSVSHFVRSVLYHPSVCVRLLLVGATMLAYTGVFVACLAFGPSTGLRITAMSAVPIIVAALTFGVRGGVFSALGLIVFNTFLIWIYGEHVGELLLNEMPGFAAGLAVGAVIGRVRDLGVRLQEQIARRKRIERQKEELSAFIVHDLKSPLAAIVCNCELIVNLPTDTELVRESAQDSLMAGRTLNRMIMNLLDVERSEDGMLVPHAEAVNVSLLLDDVARTAQHLAEAKRQTITVDSPASRVTADPDLLRRVVENLVDNALKYSPRDATVRLEARPLDGACELTVTDDGPGIPEADRARVFEKYARLERDEAAHAAASRGLGLVFCKRAIEAHGGEMTISAGPAGRGTSFHVTLPLAPVPHARKPHMTFETMSRPFAA